MSADRDYDTQKRFDWWDLFACLRLRFRLAGVLDPTSEVGSESDTFKTCLLVSNLMSPCRHLDLETRLHDGNTTWQESSWQSLIVMQVVV